MKTKIILLGFLLLLYSVFLSVLNAQVWVPDNKDGTYKNPVIYADYSDPDVIRVGDDYYLVASSFTCQPGIPVLHSKDLVNWKIINYVYTALPHQRYLQPQHGQGSWAPSIRYHNGLYYVYFCTPEEGLFVATAKTPEAKWTLEQVQQIGNWEDPCPFWDDDGKAYLLHGKVGAGPAILHRMSADGKKLLDNGKIIYQNAEKQPVLEGFKFMEKRDGYYYFAAPAGGVGTGWHSVFRSKNIDGPYEDKVVLHQGKTAVNGPHQGGFVQTQKGEWWFIHFQDKDAYGRVVHLQPVKWENGWPIAGIDTDSDGIGEPVSTYKKPDVGNVFPVTAPQTSDEFSNAKLGLQWQWQAAPNTNWYSLLTKQGYMRLYAFATPTDNGSLFYAGNLLLQKVTAPAFTATTFLNGSKLDIGNRAGIAMMGNYYTSLYLEKNANGYRLVLSEGKRVDRKYQLPQELKSILVNTSNVWLKVIVKDDATCRYEYSLDGKIYQPIGENYKIEKGTWIGAKVGIYCLQPSILKSKGYADFDFFKVEK